MIQRVKGKSAEEESFVLIVVKEVKNDWRGK
jgi:hypothetical protein